MTKNFTLGDRLIREKGGVFSRHHGIYIGFFNGVELVAENQVGFGVRYVSFNEFMQGEKLVAVQEFNGSRDEQLQIIPKINSLVGKAYDLFMYNCEHFANDILKGKASSEQVRNGVLVTTLCLLLLILVFKN